MKKVISSFLKIGCDTLKKICNKQDSPVTLEMTRQQEICDSLFRDISNFTVFNQIDGDYYEFGVYEGYSLLRVYHWLHQHWKEYLHIYEKKTLNINYNTQFLNQKRFFAIDSFEGLPESLESDKPAHFVKGAYSSSVDKFHTKINQSMLKPKNVITICGWYDKTLNQNTREKYSMDKASIIFIDCDLHESAMHVMNFMTPLIHDGTVVILDDYFRYRGHPMKGVQGAFNRWRQENNQISVAELARCSANRIAFVCHLVEKEEETLSSIIPSDKKGKTTTQHKTAKKTSKVVK